MNRGRAEDNRGAPAAAHRLPGAGPAVAAGSPRAADRLGPYRLLDKVGEGGMGVVYRGIGLYADTVAIKVLRAHVAHDADARERLRREVSTLSRVRSPYVAEVLDADVEGDRPYLVTRFVDGPPLDAVVDQHGPLSPPELVRLGRGLVEALGSIHAAGVVHRDVKPGNVLMQAGEPVLIDFGIAHVADDSRLTMTGLVMGTPGYLSPEIVEGGEVGEATDWWGWAATLAYAASGRSPFGRGPMPVVLDRVTRGQPDLTGVDPRLRPLLAAALDPDPRRRPSAQQVMAELETYSGGGTTGAISQAAPYGVPRWVAEQRPTPGPMPRLAHGAEQRFSGERLVTRPVPVPGRPAVAQTSQVPAPQQQHGPARPTWQGDPRTGLSRRSWSLFSLLLAVVAVSAVFPIVAWFLLLAWSFAARWHDKSVSSMVWRRNNADRRGSDVAVATALSPWHAFLAILSTLMTALLPLFCAVITAAVVAIAMSFVDPANATILGRPTPAAAATLSATILAWWGPGGTSLRRGSRGLVRAISPTSPARTAVVVVALLIAAVAGWWAFAHVFGALHWWPYTGVDQVPGHDLWPRLPRG